MNPKTNQVTYVLLGIFMNEFDKYASQLHLSAPSTYTRPNGDVVNMSTSMKSLYTLRGLVEEAQVIQYNRYRERVPYHIQETPYPFVVLKDGYKSKVGKTIHPILSHICGFQDNQIRVRMGSNAWKEHLAKNLLTPNSSVVLPNAPSWATNNYCQTTSASIVNADAISGIEIKRPSSNDVPRSLFTGKPMSSLGFNDEDIIAIRNQHKYTSNNWVTTADSGVSYQQVGPVRTFSFSTISPVTNEVKVLQSDAIHATSIHKSTLRRQLHKYTPLSQFYNPLTIFSTPTSKRTPTLQGSLKLNEHTIKMGYFTGVYDFQTVGQGTLFIPHPLSHGKQNFHNIDNLVKPFPPKVLPIIKESVRAAKEAVLAAGGGGAEDSRGAKHISGMLDSKGICIDGINGTDLSMHPKLHESNYKDKIFFRTADLLEYGIKTFPNAVPLRVDFDVEVPVKYTNIDELIDPLRSFVRHCQRLTHPDDIHADQDDVE